MSKFPPNLVTYLTNGFNANTGEFVGAPIFNVPADSGETVHFGEVRKSYAIPAGFMVNGIASFSTNSMNTILHSDADFKAAFTFTLAMKAGGSFRRVGLNVGIGANLALSGHLFHSIDEDRFLSYAVQTAFQVERLVAKSDTSATHGGFRFDVDGLTANFKAALAVLDASSSLQQWNAFFDLYGTHILLRGNMGGIFVVQTSTKKLQVQSDFAAELAASMESGFNAKVASGSFNIGATIKASKYLNDTLEKSTTSYSSRGGSFSTEVHYWATSCFRNPVLVPGMQGLPAPVLASITELIPEANRAAGEEALRRYMAQGHILGAPIAQNLRETYVPEIASLISANFNCSLYDTDWLSLQTTAGNVAQASAANINHSDHPAYLQYGNLLGPAAAKQAYVASTGSSVTAGTVFAYPVLNPSAPETVLGEPHTFSSLQLSATESSGLITSAAISPPSDGLLIVVGNIGNRDVASPTSYGTASLTDQTTAETTAITCVCNFQPYNSFTVPVLASRTYTLNANIDNLLQPPLIFYPTFYPFTGIGFGNPEPVQPGVVYPATEDGLLVGCLNYTNQIFNGPHAMLGLYSGPVSDPAMLVKSPFCALIPVDANLEASGATAVKPVRAGEFFTAVLTQNAQNEGTSIVCSLIWYPLIPATK